MGGALPRGALRHDQRTDRSPVLLASLVLVLPIAPGCDNHIAQWTTVSVGTPKPM